MDKQTQQYVIRENKAINVYILICQHYAESVGTYMCYVY